MKKLLTLMLAAALALSLAACGGGGTGDTNTPSTGNGDTTSTDTPSGSDANTPVSAPNSDEQSGDSASDGQETAVPNNGEWDEILCSGDGYHLVKKEVDAYDGYKITLGVVDDNGEWVQEMTDTGTFVDNVRFRAEGSSETLRDSSCYTYLGEGVFLASPGVSVFTKDEERRIGPWKNSVSSSPTGRAEVSIWECLIWNVVDNTQVQLKASKMSVFQEGYLLLCQEDEFGGGTLRAMNTKGEVTELPCQFLPNKPGHNFPVYSEGLFYACSEERSNPGFYDIEGNLVIDLHEYNMGRIFYSSSQEVNAPCFENGQAIILFQNNAGSVFKGIIDKTGAFVSEPEKVDVSTY